MNQQAYLAALAGLLHDIGKFYGRASPAVGPEPAAAAEVEVGQRHAEAGRQFIEAYLPDDLQHIGAVVQAHHRPDRLAGQQEQPSGLSSLVNWWRSLTGNRPAAGGWENPAALAKVVHLADRLAAGGDKEDDSNVDPSAVLRPILSRVSLLTEAGAETWGYRPGALHLTRASIFPQSPETAIDVNAACRQLWEKELKPALERWRSNVDWAQQTPDAFLTTLLGLWQQHLYFVPAASPWPGDEDDRLTDDVSLFHHLKVTAAIALCVADSFSPAEFDALDLSATAEQPLALLVRGDFSGIQNFIYRITKPVTDTSFDHVAKRLRGRSFYLALLGEVLADWFTRRLELSAANILFVGGGQFDLLIPLKRQAALAACLVELNEWLLATFQGELNVQLATHPLHVADFEDMRPAYRVLSQQLNEKKSRKWVEHVQDEDFLISTEDTRHRCKVCHLTPTPPSTICAHCLDHEAIGQRLPRTTHLALVYDPEFEQWPKNSVRLTFETFGVTIGLLDEDRDEVTALLAAQPGALKLVALNPTEAFIRPAQANLAQSLTFVANAAPAATAFLKMSPDDFSVRTDEVLHFDALAYLSSGAERIGILKADVDRLGLLFGEGLAAEQTEAARPTLGRVMALSGALDLFFAGWLPHICAEVFQQWQTEQRRKDKPHPWLQKVDGLFYIMYAGGDDLLVIGPWDQTLHLAQALQAAFANYACYNPNVTLSAGAVQVKPHYPVQRFTALANAAEKQAKRETKRTEQAHITVFGHAVPWVGDRGSFAALLDLGQRLERALTDQERPIPRTLLHDLGRLYRVHRQPGEPDLKPMWTPRLYYTLARRLSQETIRDIGDDLIQSLSDQTILVPVSYASLVTRKE